MKLVVQNPHFLSDTNGTKVHDYLLELLVKFRPAIRLWPISNIPRWFRFLVRKKLPLSGWTYVFSDEGLKEYDVWLNFNAKGRPGSVSDPGPRKFSGLKLVHLMDYSYYPNRDEEFCRRFGIDWVFGYARHDLHCSFFRKVHPALQGRVVPVPFGYLPRFRETIPFEEKKNLASVMGAVVAMRPPSPEQPEVYEYLEHFLGSPCGHEMRWRIRNEAERAQEWMALFLPKPTENVTWRYDSMLELNRHRFYLNDDSIMHYPPARTYEGMACGSIMLAAREPVWDDFAFRDGDNCLMYRPGDFDDMLHVLRAAIGDTARTREIHDRSMATAHRFSHANVGNSLHRQIQLLWEGRTDEARNYWSQIQDPDAKTPIAA